MLYLTAKTKILLSSKAVDFRKQIDGLVAICKNHLRQSPNSGTMFVFVNKAKTMIRVLSYKKNGYWLATKRLSRGYYSNWPSSNNLADLIQAEDLVKILQEEFATKS